MPTCQVPFPTGVFRGHCMCACMCACFGFSQCICTALPAPRYVLVCSSHGLFSPPRASSGGRPYVASVHPQQAASLDGLAGMDTHSLMVGSPPSFLFFLFLFLMQQRSVRLRGRFRKGQLGLAVVPDHLPLIYSIQISLTLPDFF